MPICAIDIQRVICVSYASEASLTSSWAMMQSGPRPNPVMLGCTHITTDPSSLAGTRRPEVGPEVADHVLAGPDLVRLGWPSSGASV